MIEDLCDHWATDVDWYAVPDRFNRFNQVSTEVDGERIHAFHQGFPRPGRALG